MDSWQPPPLEPDDPTTIMAGLMQLDEKLDFAIAEIAVIRELLEDDEGEEDEANTE
jgi:hypothetical protein